MAKSARIANPVVGAATWSKTLNWSHVENGVALPIPVAGERTLFLGSSTSPQSSFKNPPDVDAVDRVEKSVADACAELPFLFYDGPDVDDPDVPTVLWHKALTGSASRKNGAHGAAASSRPAHCPVAPPGILKKGKPRIPLVQVQRDKVLQLLLHPKVTETQEEQIIEKAKTAMQPFMFSGSDAVFVVRIDHEKIEEDLDLHEPRALTGIDLSSFERFSLITTTGGSMKEAARRKTPMDISTKFSLMAHPAAGTEPPAKRAKKSGQAAASSKSPKPPKPYEIAKGLWCYRASEASTSWGPRLELIEVCEEWQRHDLATELYNKMEAEILLPFTHLDSQIRRLTISAAYCAGEPVREFLQMCGFGKWFFSGGLRFQIEGKKPPKKEMFWGNESQEWFEEYEIHDETTHGRIRALMLPAYNKAKDLNIKARVVVGIHKRSCRHCNGGFYGDVWYYSGYKSGKYLKYCEVCMLAILEGD